MILSDSDILSRLAEGDLVIDPIDDVDVQVRPASADPRLGIESLEFQRTNASCIHPNRESEVSEHVRETHVLEGNGFILHPGDFVLGTAKGRVEIPTDLLATVEGRSSLGRLAVIIHATAGIVDLGYEGQIMLELPDLGIAPVAFTPDMRTSQLVFTEMRSPADHSYGVERGSKYQGQRGPQVSRLSSDPEFGDDE